MTGDNTYSTTCRYSRLCACVKTVRKSGGESLTHRSGPGVSIPGLCARFLPLNCHVASIPPCLPRFPSHSPKSSGQTSIGTLTLCKRVNLSGHRSIAYFQDSPQMELSGKEAFWPRGKVLGGTRCVSLFLHSLPSSFGAGCLVRLTH